MEPDIDERLRRLHERYDGKIGLPSRSLDEALERLRSLEREVGDPGSEVLERVQRLAENMRLFEAERQRERARVLADLKRDDSDLNAPFLTPRREVPVAAATAPGPVSSPLPGAVPPTLSSPRSVRFSEDMFLGTPAAHVPPGISSPAAAAPPPPEPREFSPIPSVVKSSSRSLVADASPLPPLPQEAGSTLAKRVASGVGSVNTLKLRVVVPALLGDSIHFPDLASCTFSIVVNVRLTAAAVVAAVVKAAALRVNPVVLSDADTIHEQLDHKFANAINFVCVVATGVDGSVAVLDGEYALTDFTVIADHVSDPAALERGVADVDVFLFDRESLGADAGPINVARGLLSP